MSNSRHDITIWDLLMYFVLFWIGVWWGTMITNHKYEICELPNNVVPAFKEQSK